MDLLVPPVCRKFDGSPADHACSSIILPTNISAAQHAIACIWQFTDAAAAVTGT